MIYIIAHRQAVLTQIRRRMMRLLIWVLAAMRYDYYNG